MLFVIEITMRRVHVLSLRGNNSDNDIENKNDIASCHDSDINIRVIVVITT